MLQLRKELCCDAKPDSRITRHELGDFRVIYVLFYAVDLECTSPLSFRGSRITSTRTSTCTKSLHSAGQKRTSHANPKETYMDGQETITEVKFLAGNLDPVTLIKN